MCLTYEIKINHLLSIKNFQNWEKKFKARRGEAYQRVQVIMEVSGDN